MGLTGKSSYGRGVLRSDRTRMLVIRSFFFFVATVALALLVAYRSLRRPHAGPSGDFFQAQALTLGAIAAAFVVIAVIMAVR